VSSKCSTLPPPPSSTFPTPPSRILRLAVPPDDKDFDGLQLGEDKFSRGMAKVGKLVSAAGGDIPVEITKADVKAVEDGMEEARLGLNMFVSTLNKALDVEELKLVPGKGECCWIPFVFLPPSHPKPPTSRPVPPPRSNLPSFKIPLCYLCQGS
jgi:hypothetical protein